MVRVLECYWKCEIKYIHIVIGEIIEENSSWFSIGWQATYKYASYFNKQKL